jgi:hypothetical protein
MATKKKSAAVVAVEPEAVETPVANTSDIDAEGLDALLNESPNQPTEETVSSSSAGTGNLATVEYTEGEIADLREKAKSQAVAISEGFFSLGETLARVNANGLFTGWGYEDFASYVKGELNLGIRSAQYMTATYEAFGKMPKEIQEWIKTLGWSKAKELIGRVNESNWQEWRTKIAGKSVEDIKLLLKGEKGGKGKGSKDGSDNENENGEIATKTSFALFPGQAETVNAALDKAKKAVNSDKPGHALTLICTDYLASDGTMSLEQACKRIEAAFGIKLVGFQSATDSSSVVFGHDTLASLTEDDGEGDGEDSDEGVDEDGEPVEE